MLNYGTRSGALLHLRDSIHHKTSDFAGSTTRAVSAAGTPLGHRGRRPPGPDRDRRRAPRAGIRVRGRAAPLPGHGDRHPRAGLADPRRVRAPRAAPKLQEVLPCSPWRCAGASRSWRRASRRSSRRSARPSTRRSSGGSGRRSSAIERRAPAPSAARWARSCSVRLPALRDRRHPRLLGPAQPGHPGGRAHPARPGEGRRPGGSRRDPSRSWTSWGIASSERARSRRG